MSVGPGRVRRAGAAGLVVLAIVAPSIGSITARAGEGDVERGRAVYERCAACHSLDRNRTGPRHCGVVGRRAGSVPGFRYSGALRAADFVWTPERLDAFLADPLATVPGTTMGYAGVPDARDRADLIAFLAASARRSSGCR